MTELPPQVTPAYELARLTTVRTGGRAEYFARAGDLATLERLLAWATAAGLDVNVVGSGSNLLVADDGVAGLVLKLDRALAGIERDGSHIVCGGGARLPAVSARAVEWGLSGIEFGVNIPGTVGGAVRMNANAYGGQLGRVLQWADVVTGAKRQRRTPTALGFSYRASNLAPGEIVAGARFALTAADPDAVRATLAEMRERRRAAQPSGIKTFGSTFKNPEGGPAAGRTAGQLLAQAGCQELMVGAARFSPEHANFVENTGGASTADVLELMAQGRERVRERLGIVLEPEVQLLGSASLPWETSPSP